MEPETELPGYASPAEGLAFLLGQEGGCSTLESAAAALNTDAAAVAGMIGRGEVVGYRDREGQYHVPVWQFAPSGGLVPGIAEVLAEIREVLPNSGPLFGFSFFLQPDPLCGDQTPLEALRSGRIADVKLAVQGWRS